MIENENKARDDSSVEEELSGYAFKLFKAIETVTVTMGVIDDDPVTWTLKINGKNIKIPSEHLESQKVFRQQYLKMFHTPAPKLKTEDWDVLIQALSEKAAVITDTEESCNVYIANEVFTKIKEIRINKDEAAAAKGQCLLPRDGKLLLVSPKVSEIVRALGFVIPLNILSKTMTALKLKTEGTPVKKINKKDVRVWEFFEEEIVEREELSEFLRKSATQQHAATPEKLNGVAEESVSV